MEIVKAANLKENNIMTRLVGWALSSSTPLQCLTRHTLWNFYIKYYALYQIDAPKFNALKFTNAKVKPACRWFSTRKISKGKGYVRRRSSIELVFFTSRKTLGLLSGSSIVCCQTHITVGCSSCKRRQSSELKEDIY